MIYKNIFLPLFVFLGISFLIGCEIDNGGAGSGANQSPRIISFSVSAPVIHTNQQGLLVVSAVDTDGDPLSYNFEFVTGSGSFQQSAGRALVSINSPGNNVVRVTVADGRGGSASSTINITSGNRAPIIHLFNSAQSSIQKTNEAALSVFASDPDGDALSYSYTVLLGDGTITNTNQSMPMCAVYRPTKFGGKKLLTAIVRDSYGGVSTQTIEQNVVKSWVQVGNSFGAYQSYRAFVIDGSDNLYVAARKGSVLMLYHYQGTNWVSIPLPSQFDALPTSIQLAVDGTTLYLAAARFNPMFVARYDGSSWTSLATNGSEARAVTILSYPVVDSQHRLCVGVKDLDNDEKATVMRYTGTNWELLGQRGFSLDKRIDWMGIAPSDDLFVSCRNSANSAFGDRLMGFNGTNWVTVGGQLCKADEPNVDFAFHSSGNLFFVYRDSFSGDRGYLKRVYHVGGPSMSDQFFAPNATTVTDNQIIFGKDGRLHHFFVVSDGRAYYRIYNFSILAWEDVTVTRFSMRSGNAPAALLRLDSKDRPYILVIDNDGQLVMRTLQ